MTLLMILITISGEKNIPQYSGIALALFAFVVTFSTISQTHNDKLQIIYASGKIYKNFIVFR